MCEKELNKNIEILVVVFIISHASTKDISGIDTSNGINTSIPVCVSDIWK